jgi:hypothetical protein
MPSRTSVINSLLTRYNSQIEQNESGVIETAVFKFLICQLIDKDFGSGGGGGGSTTAMTISDGIGISTEIDAILTRLASLDTKALLQADIVTAINSSVDIDAIITRLTSIDNKALSQANIQNAIDASSRMATINNSLNTLANPPAEVPVFGKFSINNAREITVINKGFQDISLGISTTLNSSYQTLTFPAGLVLNMRLSAGQGRITSLRASTTTGTTPVIINYSN